VAFIKFQKEQSKKGTTNRTIGINPQGRFAFYKPVVQKHLKDTEYVELLYDPESKQIGILPLPEATSNSFRIQGKTTKMVIAKKFLNRFNIQLKEQRYEFSVDNRMIVIQI
jgi:hypothetical protein